MPERLSIRLTDDNIVKKLDTHLTMSKQTPSEYVRNLIENDLRNVRTTPSDEGCIIQLLEKFDPAYVKKAKKVLVNADQPMLLAKTLRGLVDQVSRLIDFAKGPAIKEGDYDIEMKVAHWVEGEVQMVAETAGDYPQGSFESMSEVVKPSTPPKKSKKKKA